jgi:two-component sensor histidine kinase
MSAMSDIGRELSEYHDRLRQYLWEHSQESGEPDAGSDAALLLDALCGRPLEDYTRRFEASGRELAAQGGRLEIRLGGIKRHSAVLAAGLDEVLAEDPHVLSRAQRFLGSLVAEVVLSLARGYQTVRTRAEIEYAERARRGVTRLRALQSVNAVANSAMDLDQTLATAARAVAQEMNADLCTIFLFDTTTHGLQLRATNGPMPRAGRQFTLGMGQGYTGWVADHGQPLLIPDATADPMFAAEANAYPTPYRGLLAMPIIFFTVEKLQGVISVQTQEPRTFTDDEVSFLEIVAGQIAMSIENGRLYEQTDEELRRKIHEMGTLHRVSALVTSTLELENVLRIIVSQAVLLSGADRCVLFALDPATQRLQAVASHGFDDPQVARASLRGGQCCAARVVQSGEISMQVDCLRTTEGCFLYSHPEAQDDQHSVLCAPLSTMHGRLGALCVFSSQRHLLSTHQSQLVMTFANVAAIAMENARLFEQTREGLHTREFMVRESHHRVKNNLQQVAAILNMQRRRARIPEVEQILVESVDRIQGIAATHDLLSKSELGRAPIDEIARKIAGIVQGNLVPPQLRLQFAIRAAPIQLPTEQATGFAIILNELISNAIEHGFEGCERGEIRISGTRHGDMVTVRVADNGVGLPPEFSLHKAESLGLQLVRGLVQSELHGAVEMFELFGAPDIADPDTAAAGPDGDPARRWTVAELVFPVVLHTEPSGEPVPGVKAATV